MPPSSHTRELVLGIDFGTTYTSAGLLVEDRVELIRDEGDDMIPSVVNLPERGAPVVGSKALMRVMSEPTATIQSIKRLLGCTYDDPMVRLVDASSGYRIEQGPENKVLLKVRQTTYAPEQIVSYIIGRVRDLAERRFGTKVTKAIVTHPAAATPGYLTALRRAARVAHLEIIELLPEPVAAALAVGLHAESANRRLLICDFGGGTFDATLALQEGMSFRPVAVGGDSSLGGDDLDQAMCDAIAGAVFRRSSFDMMREVVRRQQLLFRCETVKRQLSTQNEARLVMKDAYIEQGAARDIDVVIERSWIEPRWAPLMQRAAAVVEHLLTTAQWRREELDQVVLVGGTALVPAFRATINAMFPATPVVISPVANVAVALGAALRTGAYVLQSRSVPVLMRGEAA